MSLADNAERGFKPRQEQPTLHEVCRMLTRLNYGDFATLAAGIGVQPNTLWRAITERAIASDKTNTVKYRR